MTDDPKIRRQPAPQDKARHIESYINRERPAPQPSDGSRNMSAAIEREHAKRRNGANGK